MSKRRPVLERRGIEYEPVSDQELIVGIAYAKKKYGVAVNQELLRIICNSTIERRRPKIILAMLAATVVREVVPIRLRGPQYEAYKGAVMKVFSERAAGKRLANARKRAEGIPVPSGPKETEHPEDPKHKGQFLLI